MDEYFALADGKTLELALSQAAALLGCAVDEVGWLELPSENGEVRIAAAALRKSPEGPGQIVNSAAPTLNWRPDAQPLDKPLKINGDLLALSGDLRHYGDVIVTGNVGRSANLNAAGAVLILGNVDVGAQVSARGNITVKGGILGAASSASGAIKSAYAYGGQLSAGCVVIMGDATQCLIYARDKIDCDGAVIGGRLYADNGIFVRALGSDTQRGAHASLEVGAGRRIREQIRIARERLSRVEQSEIDQGVLIDLYKMSIARLEQRLDVSNPNAEIVVYGICYSGNNISIEGAALEIKRDLEQARFVKEAQSGMLIAESHE